MTPELSIEKKLTQMDVAPKRKRCRPARFRDLFDEAAFIKELSRAKKASLLEEKTKSVGKKRELRVEAAGVLSRLSRPKRTRREAIPKSISYEERKQLEQAYRRSLAELKKPVPEKAMKQRQERVKAPKKAMKRVAKKTTKRPSTNSEPIMLKRKRRRPSIFEQGLTWQERREIQLVLRRSLIETRIKKSRRKKLSATTKSSKKLTNLKKLKKASFVERALKAEHKQGNPLKKSLSMKVKKTPPSAKKMVKVKKKSSLKTAAGRKKKTSAKLVKKVISKSSRKSVAGNKKKSITKKLVKKAKNKLSRKDAKDKKKSATTKPVKISKVIKKKSSTEKTSRKKKALKKNTTLAKKKTKRNRK